MMLQYSFGLDAIAKKIDDAVRKTIAAGYRTRDIASPDCKIVGTAEMGAAIRENLN
jgi:3-isopropylmalate dehydrogenase